MSDQSKNKENAIAFYRTAYEGKIVEHWDTIQDVVPADKSANKIWNVRADDEISFLLMLASLWLA